MKHIKRTFFICIASMLVFAQVAAGIGYAEEAEVGLGEDVSGYSGQNTGVDSAAADDAARSSDAQVFSSDISDRMVTDQVSLYIRGDGGVWVPWTAGATIGPGDPVRYEVLWHIPSKVADGDTVLIPFTGTGLRFPDSVKRNLYDQDDPSLVLGTWYVQGGAIHCAFNAAAAQKDAIDSGMFYLEATVDGSSENISVGVGGKATVPAPVTPGEPSVIEPIGPAPPVSKVGSMQLGGKLEWTLSVGVDLEQELYRNIAAAKSSPMPSPRPNLLLVDELENEQRISSPDDIALIANIHIPTTAGEVSNRDNWFNVKDQFVWIDGRDTVSYPTQAAFLAALKADSDQPSYGVYANASGNDVVYIYFGTVPSSTSKLNSKNLSFSGYPGTDAAIQDWIDSADSAMSFNGLQRSVLEEALLSKGSNKGALTAFTVIVAPDPGSLQHGVTYENTGMLMWDGDESSSGTPSVTYYDGGGSAGGRVTGALELMKTDEAGRPLPGAEFALYRLNGVGASEWVTGVKDADGVWLWSLDQTDAALLKSGVDGTVAVGGLKKGTYWMTETKAPEGYSLDSTPIRFDVIGGASAPASATFENAALPTDPVTPTNPSPPVALATPDEPAGDGGSPQVLASTGDGVVGIGCLAAIAVICATFLCVVAKRKAHVAGIEP